jgi:hypothetical protein
MAKKTFKVSWTVRLKSGLAAEHVRGGDVEVNGYTAAIDLYSQLAFSFGCSALVTHVLGKDCKLMSWEDRLKMYSVTIEEL